jgi:hypothetical protein
MAGRVFAQYSLQSVKMKKVESRKEEDEKRKRMTTMMKKKDNGRGGRIEDNERWKRRTNRR